MKFRHCFSNIFRGLNILSAKTRYNSSFDSFNFHQINKWTYSKACNCGAWFYFSAFIRWQEVDLPDSATHDAITVDYECILCGHRFLRTYELFNSGKKARNGYYGIIVKTNAWCTKRYHYYEIEAIFERIDKKYNLATFNCGHFAKKMFKKLVVNG